jgi:hypothetical protein
MTGHKQTWMTDRPSQESTPGDAGGSLLERQQIAFQKNIAGAVERSSVQYYSMMPIPDGAVELAIQPFLTDAKQAGSITVVLQALFRRAGCQARITVSDGFTPAHSPLWVFIITPEP